MNIYKIYVDKNLGTVIMFSNSDLPEMDHPDFLPFTVPEQYSELFDRIKDGKDSLSRIRVNVSSKEFKIYSLNDFKDTDYEYGKWFKLPCYRRDPPVEADLVLTIISKNFKPYLSLKFVGDPKILKDPKRHSLNFYFTKQNDLNCLYESFHTDFDKLDKNNEIVFPIERIDPDKLFQNNFSVYYRKIFKTVSYVL